jgi:hypothetical protein
MKSSGRRLAGLLAEEIVVGFVGFGYRKSQVFHVEQSGRLNQNGKCSTWNKSRFDPNWDQVQFGTLH